MLQFYFLSILLNVLTGLVFIYATRIKASSEEGGFDTEVTDSLYDDDFSENDTSLESDDASVEKLSDSENDAATDEGEGFKMQSSDYRTAAVSILRDKTFRLVLGILMMLVGLLKLLSPIQFDIAIIGDLIPALAGLAGGASLLVEWYEEKSELEVALPEFLQTLFIDGRKYLGLFCIAAGVLHFVFPRVLFL